MEEGMRENYPIDLEKRSAIYQRNLQYLEWGLTAINSADTI
jgi:hypothetical protein